LVSGLYKLSVGPAAAAAKAPAANEGGAASTLQCSVAYCAIWLQLALCRMNAPLRRDFTSTPAAAATSRQRVFSVSKRGKLIARISYD